MLKEARDDGNVSVIPIVPLTQSIVPPTGESDALSEVTADFEFIMKVVKVPFPNIK